MSYNFLANQIFLSDSGNGVVVKYRIYVLLPHRVFKQLWKPGSTFLQGSQGAQPAYAKEGEQEHHLVSFFYYQGTQKIHCFILISHEAASYSFTVFFLNMCSTIFAMLERLDESKEQRRKTWSCEQGNQ